MNNMNAIQAEFLNMEATRFEKIKNASTLQAGCLIACNGRKHYAECPNFVPYTAAMQAEDAEEKRADDELKEKEDSLFWEWTSLQSSK